MPTLFDELLTSTPTHRRRPTRQTAAYRTAITLLDDFHATLYTHITAALSSHPHCGALAALHADAEDLLHAGGDRCFVYKAGEDVAYDADVALLRRGIEGVRYGWRVVVVEGFCGCDEGVEMGGFEGAD
ncbi:uncharacterized protein LAJ45_06599 [Morchella importuna]|uniref:uncharacterized protein n=1 Tax=Morchella importuna TaxID=1174673 RepID=UPI001E8CDC19|nr:uncharacterized protein LAJ45_06599 [Morchella importuna]KAH8149519.1 hypothetical protein LAJ45_06599 [Morchella importuna]